MSSIPHNIDGFINLAEDEECLDWIYLDEEHKERSGTPLWKWLGSMLMAAVLAGFFYIMQLGKRRDGWALEKADSGSHREAPTQLGRADLAHELRENVTADPRSVEEILMECARISETENAVKREQETSGSDRKRDRLDNHLPGIQSVSFDTQQSAMDPLWNCSLHENTQQSAMDPLWNRSVQENTQQSAMDPLWNRSVQENTQQSAMDPLWNRSVQENTQQSAMVPLWNRSVQESTQQSAMEPLWNRSVQETTQQSAMDPLWNRSVQETTQQSAMDPLWNHSVQETTQQSAMDPLWNRSVQETTQQSAMEPLWNRSVQETTQQSAMDPLWNHSVQETTQQSAMDPLWNRPATENERIQLAASTGVSFSDYNRDDYLFAQCRHDTDNEVMKLLYPGEEVGGQPLTDSQPERSNRADTGVKGYSYVPAPENDPYSHFENEPTKADVLLDYLSPTGPDPDAHLEEILGYSPVQRDPTASRSFILDDEQYAEQTVQRSLSIQRDPHQSRSFAVMDDAQLNIGNEIPNDLRRLMMPAESPPTYQAITVQQQSNTANTDLLSFLRGNQPSTAVSAAQPATLTTNELLDLMRYPTTESDFHQHSGNDAPPQQSFAPTSNRQPVQPVMTSNAVNLDIPIRDEICFDSGKTTPTPESMLQSAAKTSNGFVMRKKSSEATVSSASTVTEQRRGILKDGSSDSLDGSLNSADLVRMKRQAKSKDEESVLSGASSVLSTLGAADLDAALARVTTLAEVSAVMREAGLQSSNLIFGIDYTASNKYQGEVSFGGRSLHSLDASGSVLNPYQEVITIIGRTLLPFATTGEIPAYGFGDMTTTDRAIFALKKGKHCSTFDEVLAAYNKVTPKVILSGPTNFAPLIYEAVDICRRKRDYHILAIAADGQVTNEKATRRAIVDACKYPLSIIVVGVGDGPWHQMKVFDESLPKRPWDNFHFVEFHEIMRQAQRKDVSFALECLVEIPDQYKLIKALGLLRRS